MPIHRKIGGIHFVKVGRLHVSLSLSRPSSHTARIARASEICFELATILATAGLLVAAIGWGA